MRTFRVDANSALRVLVDQSGYDLLNLGDVAMLQACVRRLQSLVPDADIGVFCHDAALLATYCPGAIPVPVRRHSPTGPGRPRRLPLVAAQLWKVLGPYTIRSGARRRPDVTRPRGWRDAVRWADVVVASGGGYVTDTWWWHGSAVLSVLRAAQRMGKPTAMFGQGLGPLSHRLLRRQASTVLPRLDLLALRGGVTGEPLARELGVRPDVVVVTGDDALEAVAADPTVVMGDALGVNVRVSGYSGVDDATADSVGDVAARFVSARDATAVVLPVALFAGSSDAQATQRALAGRLVAHPVDVRSPADLAHAVRRCRVVMTGSYHAAVFALGCGVPVVVLSRSAYYDAKFTDLAGLFPGATWQVRLGETATAPELMRALDAAWEAAPQVRAQVQARSRRQVEAGRAAYARFLDGAGVSPR